MQQKRTFFNIYEGIFSILVLGLLCNLTADLMHPILQMVLFQLPGGNTEINQLLLSSLIQTGWMVGLVFFFAKILHHCRWSDLGLQKSQSTHWLGLAISHGILLFLLMMILAEILTLLLPDGMAPQAVAEVIMTAQTPWEKVVPIVVTGILAPIGEELLFRGFIFNSLLQKFSRWPSILLTALIFGCMHGDLVRALPLMLGGIWLNLLYLKSDSLYTAMLAHSVWNITMTLMIYFV